MLPRLLIAGWALGGWMAAQSLGFGQTAPPPKPALLARVDTGGLAWVAAASAADQRLLAGRAGEVARLLDLYNYDPKLGDWRSQALSPWLDHTAVWKLDRPGAELVLLIPRSGGDPIGVIPIRQAGAGDPMIENDTHNVALYNAALGREAAQPATYGQWMRLALLYLMLTGDQPRVLDQTTLAADLGPHVDNPAQPLLPMIEPGADRTGVQFFEPRGSQELIAWAFEFDSGGRLVNLRRHEVSRTALAKGLWP